MKATNVVMHKRNDVIYFFMFFTCVIHRTKLVIITGQGRI